MSFHRSMSLNESWKWTTPIYILRLEIYVGFWVSVALRPNQMVTIVSPLTQSKRIMIWWKNTIKFIPKSKECFFTTNIATFHKSKVVLDGSKNKLSIGTKPHLEISSWILSVVMSNSRKIILFFKPRCILGFAYQNCYAFVYSNTIRNW